MLLDDYLLGLLILGALAWIIMRYHWLRVSFVGLLLTAWFCMAAVAPVVIAIKHLTEGYPIAALITLALGAFLSRIWWIGASGAYDWVKREIATGRFWMPWNAQ